MFKTAYPRSLFATTSQGISRFISKLFPGGVGAPVDSIDTTFKLPNLGGLHALEAAISGHLVAAYKMYEIYSMIEEVMGNHELAEYLQYPWPTNVQCDDNGASIVFHWDNPTEGYNLTLGMYSSSPGYKTSLYTLKVKYADKKTTASFTEEDMQYGDHLTLDISEFLPAFKQLVPHNMDTNTVDGTWVAGDNGKKVTKRRRPQRGEHLNIGT